MTGSRPRPRHTLLAAALHAASRGWPVFPLQPGSKQPAITDWERLATTDRQQLVAWWTRAPYNIGIACGPAGLVVVDLDAGHVENPEAACEKPVHGRAALAALACEAGAAEPRRTYTVATPGGGEHRYFRTPSGLHLPTTIGLLGVHVDTRATGGAIAAAGSVRWVNGCRRRYQVIRSLPVIPLPGWLARALTARPAPPDLPVPCRHPGPYARAAMAGETANVRTALVGTRNVTLFKAAARLGELVGAGFLDPAIATSELLDAARRHVGVSGFTAREARATIASGLARGQARPRTRPPHGTATG